MHSRRQFLQRTATFALATQFPAILHAIPADDTAETAIEKAHLEIWRRFIDPRWNTFYDHADFDGNVVIPTPEECRANKPNALSWDISITDGSMFGGMYMEAAIHRWMITKKAEDREKAHRIATGLMKLATVGQTKGFLARGLTADGSEHYPLSSNDQAMPWLDGMWRYVRSGIPDEAECRQIKAKIIETVEALHSHKWKVPADRPPFDYFGGFSSFDWQGASRLLFFIKMAADVSGDSRWEDLYRQTIAEKNPKGKASRLEICAKGMISTLKIYHTWTHCPGVAGLRGLWEMENDPKLKAAYEQGLKASAEVAVESLPLAEQFDNNDKQKFLLDWRELNSLWHKQKTVREAIDLAKKQLLLLDSLSPRRVYEIQYMREPLFAAWVITLCPDPAVLRQHAPAILKVIRHYRYDRLYTSQFFPAESAYYRLKLNGIV
ncbi:MAG: hypothetical protein PHR77_07100 [Kiritimatiellae bacterium]|nr:hypothetical protein [Kiritimatiellia bacterium]MDD5522962.1 hypothetical protein [Kiritimatiellia bacterium]